MTFLTKKSLPRRTMLKGLGASCRAAHARFDDPGALGAGKAGAAAAGIRLCFARRDLRPVEAPRPGTSFELSPNLTAAREGTGSVQRPHRPVASGGGYQGRRQRRSQPRRGGLADRRSCLRPHSSGRGDEAGHHGGPDRGPASGKRLRRFLRSR